MYYSTYILVTEVIFTPDCYDFVFVCQILSHGLDTGPRGVTITLYHSGQWANPVTHIYNTYYVFAIAI